MDIIKYKEKGKTKQEAQKLMNSRFQLDLEIRCICDRTLIKTESQKSFDYTNPTKQEMPNQYIWGIIQWNDSESIVSVSAWSNLCLSWLYTSTTNTRDWCLERKKNGIVSTMSWNGFCRSIVFFLSAFPWNIYATKVGNLKKYLGIWCRKIKLVPQK